MAGEVTEILFQGVEYTVDCTTIDAERPFLVLFQAFSEKDLIDKPMLGRRSHMRNLALGNDYNFILILPHVSDWYQRPEMEQVAAAILAKTKDKKRIGYGQSMGGYGVLNWYHKLQLDNAIVSAPNACCQRHIVPWDDRLLGKDKELSARGIEANRDWLLAMPPIPHGYILFDPHNLDGRHARMILEKHPGLTALPLRFCGHSPVALLKELEIEDKWLLVMMRDTDFSLKDFTAEVRTRSPEAPEFNFTLAMRLAERNWVMAALRVIRKAVTLKKNFSPALKLEAELLCRNHEYENALEILEPMSKHPKHCGRAMHVLAEYALEVPDKDLRARYLDLLNSISGGGDALNKATVHAEVKRKEDRPHGFFSDLVARVFG